MKNKLLYKKNTILFKEGKEQTHQGLRPSTLKEENKLLKNKKKGNKNKAKKKDLNITLWFFTNFLLHYISSEIKD